MEKLYRNKTLYKLIMVLTGVAFVCGLVMLLTRRPLLIVSVLLYVGIEVFLCLFFFFWMKYPFMRQNTRLAFRDGRLRSVKKVLLPSDPEGVLYPASGLLSFFSTLFLIANIFVDTQWVLMAISAAFLVAVVSVMLWLTFYEKKQNQ